MIDRHLLVMSRQNAAAKLQGGGGGGGGGSLENLETLLVLAMILKTLLWRYRLENYHATTSTTSCCDQQQQHQANAAAAAAATAAANQLRAMLSRVLAEIQHHQDRWHNVLMNHASSSNHPTTSSAA
jgi:predicted metalloprotease